MLCKACQAIFNRKLKVSDTLDGFDVYQASHHQTYSDLTRSARRGCHICHRLLERLSLDWPSLNLEGDDVKKPLFTYNIKRYDDDNVSLEFLLAPGTRKILLAHGIAKETSLSFTGESAMEFELHPLQHADGRSHFRLRGNTKISSCSALIQDWLEECLEGHTVCATQDKREFYQTRLLEIGVSSERHPKRVRLVHSDDVALHEPYVTLSHCWGGSNILKLQRDNIDRLSASISSTELPKTFIDAIEVARFLQVRYIWIDSLCIIQDSKEDWEKEAALMSDVYQNAFLNIGATASSNSHGGLFYDRNPELLRPCVVTYAREKYELRYPELWEHGINEAPLNKRAWVVQERWLCPRMLHFGREQVFWECCKLVACEVYSRGPPYSFVLRDTIYHGFKQVKPHSDQNHGEGAAEAQLASAWGAIVLQYSSSNLTFHSDKLIALSGMATQMQRAIKSEYLAGLWKGLGVIAQLDWRVFNGYHEVTSSRPDEYTAPSWSWASVNGAVTITSQQRLRAYRDKYCELSILQEYHIDLTSTNATGQVTGGYLRIRGPVHAITLKEEPPATNLEDPYEAFRVSAYPWQLCLDGVALRRFSVYLDVPLHNGGAFFGLALYSWNNGGDPEAVGLLLEEISNSPIRFRRVGILVLNGEREVMWFSSGTLNYPQGFSIVIV